MRLHGCDCESVRWKLCSTIPECAGKLWIPYCGGSKGLVVRPCGNEKSGSKCWTNILYTTIESCNDHIMSGFNLTSWYSIETCEDHILIKVTYTYHEIVLDNWNSDCHSAVEIHLTPALNNASKYSPIVKLLFVNMSPLFIILKYFTIDLIHYYRTTLGAAWRVLTLNYKKFGTQEGGARNNRLQRTDDIMH